MTPARKVHWDVNSPPVSDYGSPNTSKDAQTSMHTLQYINSQLVAHGFAPSPGISLEGLDFADTNKAVKCLMEMLGQRVVSRDFSLNVVKGVFNNNLRGFSQKDMDRAEKLSTELRTLRYDHERMTSMYRMEADKAATFERELNTHKSRLRWGFIHDALLCKLMCSG